MTIVDSLKKFLTKLGGNPNELENNATSAEIIDAISEAYTDKEGTYTEVTPIGSEGTKIATITTNNTAHDIYAPKELPAATSEDAGMVLSVNSEGAWAKANPPTELPAVTSADEGDVLGVNSSGEWVKTNVPTELPSVSSTDNGKVLSVSDGNWNKNKIPQVTVIPCVPLEVTNMIQISRYNIGNVKDIVTNSSIFDAVMLRNVGSPYEYFYCNGYERDGATTYISFIRITRGANSTKYEKALFDISNTTSFQGTYTVTTVNDPA